MVSQNPPPENIALVAHGRYPTEVAQEGQRVIAYLSDLGVRVTQCSLHDKDLKQRMEQGEFDLLIALGGDGTMLRAGHLCAPSKVPILGINLGRFGFLIEVDRLDWQGIMTPLLEGRYWLEKRMMLHVEHLRLEQVIGVWDVLNEVVVGRGNMVRPIQVTAMLDNSFLTTYVADGLIAATATGSTAYALAVGGPILPPELRTILLVPIAPHLSIDRAIVLAEGSSVTITVNTTHQAVLSADGQASVPMKTSDQVHVCASEHTVLFVRFSEPDYFYRNLTAHMNKNPSIGASS